MPDFDTDELLAFWYRQIDSAGTSWRERYSDWRAAPGDEGWSTLADALAVARRIAKARDFQARAREQQLATITCLSHSEALADHELAIECAAALRDTELDAWLRERREVIRLYGRFPARNRVLKRASTPAEAYFVVGFGQQFR